MSNTPIEFKGSSFTLSVVYLHNKKPEVIRQALEDKIAQAPDFLKHAPIVLNVSNLIMPLNWQHLYQEIISTGLRIVGVSGCKDVALKKEIDRFGLPILSEGKNKFNSFIHKKTESTPSSEQIISMIKKPQCIDAPIRSGQRIYALNCDLIVTSHVSASAELISDGNIHIYGMMRGRALAGASGDRNAKIFCTHLMAELLSIAGIYWLSDKIPIEFYDKAVRVHLVENILTIQPLN